MNDPVLSINIALATKTLGERLPDCQHEGCGKEASHLVELHHAGASHAARSCHLHLTDVANELAAGADVVFRLEVDREAAA
jgi:hypothetical protein